LRGEVGLHEGILSDGTLSAAMCLSGQREDRLTLHSPTGSTSGSP
jgi:hypothetical protein